ncbi:MAG: hypothetical protein M1821_009707 [Bathelium mastoideum]|nr:MAG: hypothetical protein M1821_009707 [Bathelium mastoideum]
MKVLVWTLFWLTPQIVASQAPLSIPPSQYWDGDDGSWSSFKAMVGTPPQNVRVYPASSQSSLWVVLPEGCTGDEPSDCKDSRGYLFQKNESSTWSEKGLYELTTTEENYLGLTGNGDWGYDTVTLGWQGDDAPSLNNSLVTGIATPDFYLGVLGINNQPVNFTTFNDPQPSLLVTLKEQGKIPSLSWGYTAGAWYQQPFGFGSLTLGGYDTTRFSSNNLTIPFGPDSSRDLLMGVQSIRSSNSQAQLLPQPGFFWIDSTVTQIWLPADACTAFEQAFGITWDDSSSLYLVNDTLHNQLLSANPNITFTVGSQLAGGTTVDITFPYAAFDLNVSLPLVNGSSRYFPLQRAANATQYTFGRTFLQQAYVTADYERSTFQVQQADFPDQSSSGNLVAIQPANATVTATRNHSSKFSVGAKIGVIAGGAIAVLLVVAVLLMVCVRRRRNKGKPSELPANSPTLPSSDKSYKSPPSIEPPSELDPFGKVELPAPAHRLRYELAGYYKQPSELPVNDIRKAEMMGSSVKGGYLHEYGPTGHPAYSEWASYSTNNASTQRTREDMHATISIHELPAHVPVSELDSSNNTHSTTTLPSSTTRSPISPAFGSSPTTGGVSAFPRPDRDGNDRSWIDGGWI